MATRRWLWILAALVISGAVGFSQLVLRQPPLDCVNSFKQAEDRAAAAVVRDKVWRELARLDGQIARASAGDWVVERRARRNELLDRLARVELVFASDARPACPHPEMPWADALVFLKSGMTRIDPRRNGNPVEFPTRFDVFRDRDE